MSSALHPRPNRLTARSAPEAPTTTLPGTGAPLRPGDGEQVPVLDTLLRILRNRKRWIVPALVLVPALVAILTLRQPDEYTAKAGLLFRDAATELLSQNTGYRDPAVVKATNEGLIALPVVSQRTAAALDGDRRAVREHGGRLTEKDVADAIDVTSPSESDLVEIRSVAGAPYLAARMANVYGEQYIAFRQHSDRRQLQAAIDRAREGLDALPPAQRDGPAGASFRDRLNQLETTQSLLTGNAELVQRANIPTKRSSPKVKRNLVLGILFGGVLGLVMAGLRERLDSTVRTDEELEQIYGVPVLMRLPRNRKLERPRSLPDAPELVEAFRILRANLRYFNVDGQLRSILVSSPTSGDGKSTVARGLAMTMASMGDAVVLVEADLHKAVSPTTGERAERGLSSVLSGTPLSEAVVAVPVGESGRSLTVLPPGPLPPNPVELLESSRMATLLVELETRYDLVIIDTPALAQVSDARPLLNQVSGVLVVSALGQTARPVAVDFRKQLLLLDARPLGVVANLAALPQGGGYYH